MKLFWHDSFRGVDISYLQLINEIFNSSENKYVVKDHNPYIVFLNILKNLSCKQTSIILDADLSEKEIENLGLNEEDLNKTYKPSISPDIKDFDSFIEFLSANQYHLYIDIYTSGTTGTPKKISQSLANVIRSVKVNEKNSADIWAFAYNPTHFAGLQVFFQAIFNQNPLIYCFHGDFKQVAIDIETFHINRLSCTPTFIKMLLPFLERENRLVKSITFGGEKFDKNVEDQLLNIFPLARVINVYASTEAGSLLASDGEYFCIPDKYMDFIKINDCNELLIHKSLLGKSDTLTLHKEWYNTGDRVEYIDEKRFKVMGRSSDIINVGGYKVNPEDVEQLIKSVDGVEDVFVYGRQNALTGAIVVADVIILPNYTAESVKSEILHVARLSLQEWKIPRIINFVNNFKLTRTGKIKKVD